jgi:hypothetical protein
MKYILGPTHDRHIYLKYKNVEKNSISCPDEFILPPRGAPHGDLLIHELAIAREGLFSHELVFSKGTVFKVHFADLEHRVELTAKQA